MFLGHLRGHVDGPAELLDRLDDVVGRHHQHDRGRVLAGDERGPQADAGGRVPAARLADDVVRGSQAGSCACQLPRVGRGGDDPGALRRRPRPRCGPGPAASSVRSPPSVRNCLGRFCRLRGQNRVPPPPAMISACSIANTSSSSEPDCHASRSVDARRIARVRCRAVRGGLH